MSSPTVRFFYPLRFICARVKSVNSCYGQKGGTLDPYPSPLRLYPPSSARVKSTRKVHLSFTMSNKIACVRTFCRLDAWSLYEGKEETYRAGKGAAKQANHVSFDVDAAAHLTKSVQGDETTRRFGPNSSFFLLSNQVTNQPALCMHCMSNARGSWHICRVLLLQDCTNTHLISTATIFCREAVGSYVFYTVAYIL